MIASNRSLSFIPPSVGWSEILSEVTGQSREGHEPSLLVARFNFYWLHVTIIHNIVLDLGR